MRISLFLVACFAVYAVESRHLQQLRGSILPCTLRNRNLGSGLNENLRKFLKEIGQTVINKAKDILTDGLQLSAPEAVRNELQKEVPSAEGVFEAIGDLLTRKAQKLTQQYNQDNPSHEGIVGDIGFLPRFNEAEEYLNAYYNNSLNYNGPSHEGILGSFGGFAIKGLGDLIGGSFGNILKGTGDFIGNLFYVVPQYPISQEGIVPVQTYPEGVLSNVGNLLQRGAGRLSRQILKGYFSSVHHAFENIFLARGHFHTYPHLEAIGQQEIIRARRYIHRIGHPEAKACSHAAERNFTKVLNSYVNNGQHCVKTGHSEAANIVELLQDVVFDSVRRVEGVYREAGFCFDKFDEQDRGQCVDHDLPQLINQHRDRIRLYAPELADHVKRFSQINTNFDVCLTRHLGTIRKQIYKIVNDFRHCLPLYPSDNAPTKEAYLLNYRFSSRKQIPKKTIKISRQQLE